MCTLIVDGKTVCIACPGETFNSVVTSGKKQAHRRAKKIPSPTPEADLYKKRNDEETFSFSHHSVEREAVRIPYNDGTTDTCRYRNGSHRNSGRKPTYKNHHRTKAQGKAADMRAKYKRPTHNICAEFQDLYLG